MSACSIWNIWGCFLPSNSSRCIKLFRLQREALTRIPALKAGAPSEHLPDVCVEVRRVCVKDEEEETGSEVWFHPPPLGSRQARAVLPLLYPPDARPPRKICPDAPDVHMSAISVGALCLWAFQFVQMRRKHHHRKVK